MRYWDTSALVPLLLEQEARGADVAVVPRDRGDLVGVAAGNRLEWNLDGQVEVGRDEWPAALDDTPPVALEGIGDVVVSQTEEDADQTVGGSVDAQLETGISGALSPSNES